jgi:hypothetical protein
VKEAPHNAGLQIGERLIHQPVHQQLDSNKDYYCYSENQKEVQSAAVLFVIFFLLIIML